MPRASHLFVLGPRLPGVFLSTGTEDQVDVDDLGPVTLPATADPSVILEKSEMCAFLHGQVAALPPKYRMVITLFYLQGMSYQEIGQVLDLPPGTVKTHLFRARERLKREIEPDAEM